MSISLIVGLGNPGSQYGDTRHNAGFYYVDELARQFGGHWQAQPKYFAEVCQVQIAGDKVWLMKPMTYMNRSGQAVAALANFYKISVDEILVAHDELDLPPGIAKFKKGGGHGGHNGLRDIISCMANQKEFYRLRIGIGHPGQAKQVADFVLSKPSPTERTQIEVASDCALKQIELVVSGRWADAMQNLHSFRAP